MLCCAGPLVNDTRVVYAGLESCNKLYNLYTFYDFLSCHYNNPIQCLAQSFGVSSYTIRTFRDNVCCNSGHSRKWFIIWSVSFHLHIVLLSYNYIYFHFSMLCCGPSLYDVSGDTSILTKCRMHH